MGAWFRGPSLLVHMLAVSMASGLFLPLLYLWTGSLLYAFLISVGLLAVYGWCVLRLAIRAKRVPPSTDRE